MKNKIFKFVLVLSILFTGMYINAQADFSLQPNEEHSFFIIPDKVIDMKEYVGSITKYVWKNHAKDRLKINNIEIGKGEKTFIVHITEFRDKQHAMSFFNDMKTKFPDFLHMGMTKSYYAVSKTNYEAIVRNQGIGEYEQFFKSNYLSK